MAILSAERARRHYYRGGKEWQREYRRRTRRTRFDYYLGVVTCSKCGMKGYAEVRKQLNVKTGMVYCRQVIVMHHHKENGRNVYDGVCYIKTLKKRGEIVGVNPTTIWVF